MADENHASPSPRNLDSANLGRTSATNNAPQPAGLTFRRAATFTEPSQLRHHPNGGHETFANLRRRSSTYSDYLETSADELLNPSKPSSEENKKSPFVYIPIISALLPAIAGVFFENGAAFSTDLILLGLAAIFLHWSVTQPWDWYRSAQEVRVTEGDHSSGAIYSDIESTSTSASASASVSVSTALENLPKEKGEEKRPEEEGKRNEAESEVRGRPSKRNSRREERHAAAVKELHMHELLALAWCFIFPMLGAYLLHTIRGQLSRPSEGLVSDYNLTIFLCAAEIRPASHLIRMLQKRTLHVQALVAENPYVQKPVSNDQIKALYDRLNELEARWTSGVAPLRSAVQPELPQELVESAVGRELRRRVQPELEALNRAMRRYEKRLTLLASQSDSRIEYMDSRFNDAIALAAIAAKNSNSQRTLVGWLTEKMTVMTLLPVQTATAVVTFPFRTASTLLRWTAKTAPEKAQRPLRNMKPAGQGKSNADRVPTRMSRR
ncbi:hypothetical protein GGR50DRAFT_407971 [Xylaria sp. CBS 124048]|nr:hypothetical protein GGR50DRAFT_407971 [Xylaria sp. CBS 124048]